MKQNKAPEITKAGKQLYKAVASVKTADEAQKFLHDLCTPAELQAMADRWQVVQLLRKGKSYRDIYAETGVSVTTVGRVARALTFGDSGYRLIAGRLEKKSWHKRGKPC